MLTLDHLPPPPGAGLVTACECECILRSQPPTDATLTAKQMLGSGLINIAVGGHDGLRSSHMQREAKDAFRVQMETPLQRITAAYYERGLEGCLNEISDAEGEGGILGLASVVASSILCGVSTLRHLTSRVTSSSAGRRRTCRRLYRQISSSAGPISIVCIAWHPHTSTAAAAASDDTVRVFSTSWAHVPLLKHALQQHVSALEWMPYSSSVLAVGCEAGVLLWSIDPASTMSRPSGSCLVVLPLRCPSPFVSTTLSWHPRGQLLACYGSSTGGLVVWDAGREVSAIVHSGLKGSYATILWSPDGTRLLVAPLEGAYIKVFETTNWTYERWDLPSSLQSAAWSATGRHLLFVTSLEPHLFLLTFSEGQGVGGARIAAQVADFTRAMTTDESGEDVMIGGLVQQITWDPRCERLAVVFRESCYVALCHTVIHPQLQLAPGGIIKGEDGQTAVSASFQRNNGPTGAVLSLVWSNNFVQQIPLRYTSRQPHDLTCNSDLYTTLADASTLDTTLYTGMTPQLANQKLSPVYGSPSLVPPYAVGINSPFSHSLSGLFMSP